MTARLAPPDAPALAVMLNEATRDRHTVEVIGGGTASRCGVPHRPADLSLSTEGLTGIVDHQPADLTVTVRAGTPVEDLQRELAAAGQTWMQAPDRPGGTVGGVISTATSGHRRLKLGAIRDSVLQVVLCTGDGRIVTSGGKTVKGVAGYDITRLVTGARGTLGVITEVTLKLWPLPTSTRWCTATGTPAALTDAADRLRHSPAPIVSILQDPGRLWVELEGPEPDLTPPEPLTAADGAPPSLRFAAEMVAGVPPGRLGSLSEALDEHGLVFRSWPGVGTCQVEVRSSTDVHHVRALAAALDGHAMLVDAPEELRSDAPGPDPAGLVIMQRMRTAFDPGGILNPWLVPGARAEAAA